MSRWFHPACLLAGAALIGALAGCNTVKGFGTDIHDVAQNTQHWLEDSLGAPYQTRTPSPLSSDRSVNQYSAAEPWPD